MNHDDLPLPPHSIEAEQAILGALMVMEDSAADKLPAGFCSEHFYRDDHQRIFRACQSLMAKGRPVDVLTVLSTLEAGAEAEQAGGLYYLGELANGAFTAVNVGHYAQRVMGLAQSRELMAAAMEIAQLAQGQGDIRMKLDRAQQLVGDIADQSATRAPRLVREIAAEFLDSLERRTEGKERSLPSGFAELDRLMRMRPGNLIILAGRPASGKTTLAMNIAERVALAGNPALAISMEMEGSELTERLTASLGRIDLDRLGSGQLTGDDWGRLTFAVGQADAMPLWIDDQPAQTVLEVRAKARSVKRKQGGLSLLVVDYLGLMESTGKSERRDLELSAMTRGFKSLAKELGIPVILLCQLNRQCEQRPDKRPIMSDLRESGGIEQDADVVAMVYRDELYNPDSPDRGTAEIIFRKIRGGKIGTARLAFRGEYNRFEDLAPSWQSQESQSGSTRPMRGYRED